ncbi:MAG: pyridoxal phosphate-dependent aminotransferase [Clostridiales bacterium]|nr:pyridoxal phosphate-dependent aminotransferase [Clostridiales bacterium]
MTGSIFDEVIDRKNTGSIKHDFAVRRGLPEDVLPLWVADMDFKSPQCVIDALTDRSRHGVFGYSDCGDDYVQVLQKWFIDRFGWEINPEWLVKTPGVVYAAATAIRAYTREGDAVLIQEPVYYPFREIVIANSRKLAVSELVYDGSSYSIDFEDFEKKTIENSVKLFILCSPHNPVGRVWSKDELVRLGEICHRHHVIVVSDEIHADFVYPGHTHTVFSGLRPEYADFTITCTAPTKTFNLAALQISNIFIPNPSLRSIFRKEIDKSGYSQLNIMGMVACMAAYTDGHAWLEALKTYLTGNLEFLRAFLKEKLPQVKLVEPEGTYLVWLDMKALNLDEKALEDMIIHKAKLWLDGGAMFGQSGAGFQRVNIACPRVMLERALRQLYDAVKSQ